MAGIENPFAGYKAPAPEDIFSSDFRQFIAENQQLCAEIQESTYRYCQDRVNFIDIFLNAEAPVLVQFNSDTLPHSYELYDGQLAFLWQAVTQGIQQYLGEKDGSLRRVPMDVTINNEVPSHPRITVERDLEREIVRATDD